MDESSLKEKNPKLFAIRHSLAHVLAQAVQIEFPGVKLGFGPPTETGFFYDFDFQDKKISDLDLPRIEERMRAIIKSKQTFSLEEADFAKALQKVESLKEPYKVQNIENLKARGVSKFSFYSNGPFTDLCEGPHVENTAELPLKAFKLDRLAGAYWLGSEANKMLTRIYALAFETKEELQDFVSRRERAQQFDHKVLGQELELFFVDDLVGKGLPMWLPNGAALRDQIETFAKEMEFKAGYKRVSTPVLAKDALFLKSQHLPAYEESMFPPMRCHDGGDDKEGQKYYLRPMNCPHHHLVYGHKMRSYRDLPLRLAEYGSVFRYEQSGELSGLLRVRGMTQNDAHIYCRLDQVEEQIASVLSLYLEFYRVFQLKSYTLRLSLRDPENLSKFKGADEMWVQAEAILRKCLDEAKVPYYVGIGEAAFYGPKIDVQFKNLMGREETVSTIQLDFLAAVNFQLKYIDASGKEEAPVVIHRAPLSTHERFVSYLIEYYGGAFPTWLAPVQVVLIPISTQFLSYCEDLEKRLFQEGVRVELDTSDNTFGKKIRNHSKRKIPILLIAGQDEVDKGTVTVRRYGIEEQTKLAKEEFIGGLLSEIKNRVSFREPMASLF
ncbi:MAG: threonine--tRNA ligase [Oligoflexales bacterium]|nr:threonine--tRNA ligase [Oligoflexales bacterium]